MDPTKRSPSRTVDTPQQRGASGFAPGDLVAEILAGDTPAAAEPVSEQGITEITSADLVLCDVSLEPEPAVPDADVMRELSSLITPHVPAVEGDESFDTGCPPRSLPRATPSGQANAQRSALSSSLELPGALSAVPTAADLMPPAELSFPLWSELLTEEIALSDPRRAAVLLYEQGRAYEQSGSDPERAIACYAESAARAAGFAPSCRALLRHATREANAALVEQVVERGLAASPGLELELSTFRLRLLLESSAAESPLVPATRELMVSLAERAVALAPRDPVVTELIDATRDRTSAVSLAAPVRERRLVDWQDRELRSAFLAELGGAHEASDPVRALAHYRAALAAHPENLFALHGLIRLSRARGELSETAALCEQLARMQSGAAAAVTLADAARLYADELHDVDRAVALWRKACDLTPDDPLPRFELAGLLRQARRYRELADVLARTATAVDEPVEAASLAHLRARILLERLDQRGAAIDALRLAVARAPTHTPSRRLLGRLYLEERRYDDLVALRRIEIDLFSDPHRRAAVWYRIGDILEHHVGDLLRAREAYRESLTLIPSFSPALRGISRILVALGSHEAVVTLYEGALPTIEDEAERLRLLREMASIWEFELADVSSAISCYQQICAHGGEDRSTLRALLRLYAASERWEDVAATYERKRSLEHDLDGQVRDLFAQSQVLLQRLNRPAAARAVLEQLLKLRPTYQLGFDACHQVLRCLGDVPAEIQLLRRGLEQPHEPRERGFLLYRLAELLSGTTDAPVEAAAAFVEAALCDGRLFVPVDQLAWLARRADERSAIVTQLGRLPLPEHPALRALLRRRIAELLLRDRPLAHVEESLRRGNDGPFDPATLDHLVVVHSADHNVGRQIEVLQTRLKRGDDPRQRRLLLHQLAMLWEEQNHDLERAAALYVDARAAAPDDPITLRRSAVLAIRLGHWEEAARSLSLLRLANRYEAYRTAIASVLLGLFEHRVESGSDGVTVATALLEQNPTGLQALELLERHHRSTQDYSGLINVFGRQLALAEEPAERAAIRCAIAALHANRGDLERALEGFRAAAAIRPPYPLAFVGLERAASLLGDQQERVSALQGLANACHARSIRARARIEAAATLASLPDRAGDGEQLLQKVLEEDPAHMAALEALTLLLADQGKYADLAELLSRAAEHAAHTEDRRKILEQLAIVQAERIDAPAAAVAALREAVAAAPGDRPLLLRLADYSRKAKDPHALLAADQELLQQTTEPQELKRLHAEIGEIKAQLGAAAVDRTSNAPPDDGDAISEYQQVVALDPSDLQALERLSELLTDGKDWVAAARATELLASKEPDRKRKKKHLLRLAGIRADGLADPLGALDALRRALALDPTDVAVTDRMSALLLHIEEQEAHEAHVQSAQSIQSNRLDRDPFDVGAYTALYRSFEKRGMKLRADAIRALLDTIGAKRGSRYAVPAVDQLHPRQPLPLPLTAKQIDRTVHPDEAPLRQLLLACAAPLRSFHVASAPRDPRGLRFTAHSHPELSATLTELEKCLGLAPINRLTVPEDDPQPTLIDTDPPTVVIPRAAALAPTQTLKFQLAQRLAHVRLSHTTLLRLGQEGIQTFIAATAHVLVPGTATILRNEASERLARLLEPHLGPTLRKALLRPAQRLLRAPLDLPLLERALELSADRLALLATLDIGTAIRAIFVEEATPARHSVLPDDPEHLGALAGPRLRHLLNFISSEGFLVHWERACLPD